MDDCLDAFDSYFLGFFAADGNGSLGVIRNNRPFVGIVCKSDKIKEFIVQYVKREIGLDNVINRNKRDNIYNSFLMALMLSVF